MSFLGDIKRKFNNKLGKKKGDKAEKKKKKKRDGKNKASAEEVQCMVVMEVEEDQPLETLGRELVQREELMMTSGSLSEEDQTQLSQDLDQLWTQIQLEVQKTFGPDFRGAGLRAAVLCVQMQEDIDQRWSSLDSAQVPVWRPKRALQNHNELLENMVQARLSQRPPQDEGEIQVKVLDADGEQSGAEEEKESDQASVDVSKEVRCMGNQMRQDLLYIEKTVAPCYPEHMDILNTFVKLYHRFFSSRLEEFTALPLNDSALYCLLHWTNYRYRNILEELQGKVDTDSLDPLLPTDVLQKLQDQYLNNTQSTTQEWLERALKIEEESWSKNFKHSLDTSYCLSPLASDVLQVLDSAVQKVSCTGTDQSSHLSALLDSFLCRYVSAVKEFIDGNHSNVPSVVKAQLVCEEQFREFVLRRDVAEEKRASCLKSLDAVRDCGYCSLTSGICSKLKEHVRGLWTESWLDGSLSAVDSVLDFLDQQLEPLSDLKPSCSQWVLDRLHRDVALRYFKNILKTRRRSQTDQVGGATRMKEDVNNMDAFFTQRGSGSTWVTQILLHVAEVLGLKDPDSIQLELVSLVQLCPDLRLSHVSRLLMLKAGLSLSSIRSIHHSVTENRPQEPSANHCPPFFSLLKETTFIQSVCLWVQLHLSTCCC